MSANSNKFVFRSGMTHFDSLVLFIKRIGLHDALISLPDTRIGSPVK